jgi:nucleoporin NDC1
MFITLAFFHSLAHLMSDQDRVPYPLRAVKSKDAKDQTPSAVEAPLVQIRRALSTLALSAGTWALWLTVPGTLSYFFLFRSVAWGNAFSIVQYMYFLPKAQRAHPTGLAPFGDLVGRVLIESFLIVFLWQFTNVVYSAYISQEPLKKNKPLTADSKDPNGSLIVGLKAKKEFAKVCLNLQYESRYANTPKATAFWELVLITTRFPERRQTIYSELDRMGGSTWSQIQSLCLAEVSAIRTRIDKFTSPPATQSSAPSPAAEVKGRQPITAPLKTDPIFVKAPPPATELKKAATYIGDVARKHGNSPNAKPLQKALEYSSHKLLTDAQREQIAPAHIQQKANGILTQIVHNPYIGYIFQQRFSRRASSIIFNGTLIGGTQYSTASVTISAVDALSQLLVQSLKEDKYGQVSQSVPSIIRAYTEAIKAMEVFLANSSPHWSDVNFQNSHRGEVGDVEVLMEALKDGLENIFGTFGEYLEGMGMSQGEIAQCKGALSSRSALGGKKEMEKVLA